MTDGRHVHRRLGLLFEGARKVHREDVSEEPESRYQLGTTEYDLRELVPEELTNLEHVPLRYRPRRGTDGL